jgi:hypothetical protein
MRQGAALDAQGLGPEEIGEIVGVSRQTVSDWRGYKLYQEELEKWVDRDVAKVKPLLAKIRIESLDAHAQAVKRLVEGLDSEKEHIRMQAAREIVNMPIIRSMLELRGSEERGPSANAIVNLVIKTDGDGHDVIEYSNVEEGEVE